jgi:hypothetical protein
MTQIYSRRDLSEDTSDNEEKFYAIKKRIYQAAKDGFSINMMLHLKKIESQEVRNVLINQVNSKRIFSTT